MAPGESWPSSPLLELCSSLLSAVRTLAVCMCAETTQIWKGIGSALARAGRSGSAAGTVWALWALSHASLLLLSERRADKGVLNDQKFYFPSSSTDPVNIPFVLPQGDRSGNSSATASAFLLVGFLKLSSFFTFFCPS